MEEFGFFETVAEHLPEDFTIIYEIARIIEDLSNPVGQMLAPILELQEPNDSDTLPELHIIPNVQDAKEYEADLIKSVTDVRHIYPHQFLLPETVFLQRLAERSLWMPRAKTPKNFRYQTESEKFAPDDRKQKVYVIFDTSSSMQHNFRIHLAKAIAYLFLRTNQKELGTVFFRTFDLTVGELLTARDLPGFDELISHLMHIKAVGNGTVLQKAIQTAIDDISHESQLSSAQILVITDGVAMIDYDKLKEQMADSIVLNTVKIGHAKMHVDAKVIEDQIYHSNSDDAVRLKQLVSQRKDVELQMSTASGSSRVSTLQSQLGLVQKQIDTLTERIGAHLELHLGSEIQKLSKVYVEIDDIAPEVMFALPEQQVRELEILAEKLLEALKEDHQVEDVKRAAVLYDHLMLLMEYNHIDASRFAQAAKDLETVMDHILNDAASSAQDLSISDMERMQLRNMLSLQSFANKLSLAKLIQLLLLKLRRWWRGRRQIKLFKNITGKRITFRSPHK